MTRHVDLEFYNPEATPCVVRLNVSRASVAPIMEWYGAFCAGDEYAVMIDGEEVPQDINGEFLHDTIEGETK